MLGVACISLMVRVWGQVDRSWVGRTEWFPVCYFDRSLLGEGDCKEDCQSTRAKRTLRCGHLISPFLLQIFFSRVGQIPRALLASLAERWKNLAKDSMLVLGSSVGPLMSGDISLQTPSCGGPADLPSARTTNEDGKESNSFFDMLSGSREVRNAE